MDRIEKSEIKSRDTVSSVFTVEANPERQGHPNPSLTKPGFYEEYHQKLSLNIEFLERFIEAQKWIFAKTMPKCPHWYVVRGKGPNEDDFVNFVRHIRAFGYDELWGRDIHRYLDFQGFRYWTMGFVMSVTVIINRCELGSQSPRPCSETPRVFFAKPASPGTALYSPN